MNFRVAAIALSMAYAGLVRAQPARPGGSDSLPRDLVEALLRPYYGSVSAGGSGFVIGRVPADLVPYLYVPPGARVLGGVETSSRTVVVLSVTAPLDELRSAYRREQLRLGWTSPVAPSQGWGFVQAPGTGPDINSLVFCHIGQSLQIVPYSAPSSGGPLVVTATVENYGSSCQSRVRFVPSTTFATDLPVIFNPDGAAMNSRACYPPNVSASGVNASGERLETKLSPVQLLAHFSRQLSDSGWTAASSSGAAVKGVWTRPDTGELTRELTLTITPSPAAGCQDLLLQVRRTTGR